MHALHLPSFSGVSGRWMTGLLLLTLVPMLITAPYVLLELDQPTSTVASTESHRPTRASSS